MIRWIKWPIIVWNFIAILSAVPAAAVITLADSVDAPGVNWTTDGAAPWLAQTAISHDGVDAAQSGAVVNGQSSWLETQVSGDSQVSFWWRVSSEPGYDFLTVYVDGVPQSGTASPISGEVAWTQVTLQVSGGVGATHTIRWEYAYHAVGAIPPNTAAANPGATNSAWLDQVVVTPAVDADGDGFFNTVDCNDSDPASNPGAAEIINDGIDQDCTGRDATAQVADSVDNPGLSWTFAGNAPWDGQAMATAHDGVDAAQSSSIGNGQSSEIKTTVTVSSSANQLSFWWRVSSEQDFDILTVYVDDQAAGAISGEVGWTRVILPLSAGPHTIRWVYGKDIADSAGSDAGWLDQVVMVSAAQIAGGTLAESVDAPALTWITGGATPWTYQTSTTYDGVDAAQSGVVGTGQGSWLETTISGDNMVSFWWRVSSEPGYDLLSVSVDGIPQSGIAAPISGERGWTPVTLNVLGSGAHTIRWQYAKHTAGAIPPNTLAANPGAADRGWLDQVVVTPAADADGDGYQNTVDCNDADPAINPGAQEIITDGIDQDCTGRDATAQVADSVDNATLTWTFAGNAPWDGQAMASAHDGVDAAQSSPIGDVQTSEMRTTINVSLPTNQLSFWWRVSSEQDFDILTVYVDNQAAGAISGEVGWTHVILPLSPGPHDIRWVYSKDIADSAGSDAGWLDQVVLVSAAQIAGGTLAESVDATALTWTTGGATPWTYQTTTTHDGVDAAQSGVVGTGQSSWLETTISGDSQVSFWWRVSSEPGYDYLTVYVDGIPRNGAVSPISGEVGWLPVLLNVPGGGTHTIRWEYAAHTAGAIPPNSPSANPTATNSAWLDQVVVTPAVDADGDGLKNTVDCNDADPAINPGAQEILSDGIDQDCTGRDATTSVANSVDNFGLTWTFAGDLPWDGQTTATAHDGEDAAQSSPIADGQSSEIRTTVNVTLPNNQLSFWWRVSSEQDFDILTVYVDDQVAGAISGEVGWTRVVLPLSAGPHDIRWLYGKDISDSAGSDSGWLDQVVLVSAAQIAGGTLAESVDALSLTWTTGGATPWTYQTSTTHDGVDAAQSGVVGSGQSSWLETTISGDNKVFFWWRVSSEPGYDTLTVLVDGIPQNGAASPISGESGWLPVLLNVPGGGTHTIRWQYATHAAGAIPPNSPSANPGAGNSAWLDQVVVTPAVDNDGDGYKNTVDCNESDPAIHPGALEILNDGIDQDCTGRDATAQVVESVDNPALSWTFAGNQPWDGQATAQAHDGVDAAQSSPLGDGQSSELRTTINVSLPNNQLSFWWRVSSEQDFDLLTVYVDDVAAGAISGEVAWSRVLLPLSVGTHTIRWVYGKDTAGSAGSDSGWLDQVFMVADPQSVSGSLAEGVDALALPWTTGGNAPWAYQTATTQDGVDAVQSGAILLGQSSWLETTITGDNQVSFWWKVSSEPNNDFLTVSVDGVPQGGAASAISGEVGWTQVTLNLPGSGAHTVKWTYSMHASGAIPPNTPAGNPGASNSAWLDQVVVTPAVDGDGDGFLNTVDCNDGNPAIHAGLSGYSDQDGDGWTVGGAQQFCTAAQLPAGYLASQNDGDCSDTEPAVNPGVLEIINDGIDQDCSGRDATATIEEGVDNPGLAWSFAGSANWDGQATPLAHDGVDAAQSGVTGDGESSELLATVSVAAPNTELSFWWRVSSEQDFDFLTVYVDDVAAAAISGEVGWTRVLLPLAIGTHTIRWAYHKDVADAAGMDEGWLDQVVLVTGAQIAGGTLAESVDATSLTWTTGGDAPWAYQTDTTYDGVDAAQSGAITIGQGSWLETTVSGDNQVTFWWRVSSEPGYDFLSVAVDGAPQGGSAAAVSGEVGWTPVTVNVSGAGSHTIRWQYDVHAADALPPNTPAANPGASNSAWLDQVVVTPALDSDGDGFLSTLDCDDNDPALHAALIGYLDQDGDTWTTGPAQQFCTAGSLPSGYAASQQDGDCDDTNPAINPGISEIINDGIDQGCSGRDATASISDSVDNPALSFTFAGSANWDGQATALAHDGIDAAQSGMITHGESSEIMTTITVSAASNDLSFWWRVSSEEDFDFLTVYVDGVAAGEISGEVGWTQVVLPLSVGTHTIRWVYGKDESDTAGADEGWLDQVQLMADQAITVTTPAPAQAAYHDQFTVAATAPGGPVTYSSGSPGICGNNGPVFTMLASQGSCVVQYNQAGSANYHAAAPLTSLTLAQHAAVTGGVQINNGATLTNSATVTLSLSAIAPQGVKEFMVSNDGATYQSFAIVPSLINFSNTISWTLDPGDGPKTVYVKYVDSPLPSNVYGPFTADITVDTAPPVTQASPLGGAYNGAINVVLTSEPGAAIYYTTGPAALTTANGQLYSGPITIPATATLQYLAVDPALNQEAAQSQTYTIVGADLTGGVQINSGAAFTNSATVSLTLAAADPLGVQEYMISNDDITYQTVAIAAGTTNFGATVPWDLTAGDGLKRVYVKYVDAPLPNNVYGPFIAEITLDTTVPVTTANPGTGTYNGAINVVLASEPGATIYYTTNAAALTVANGQVYTGPITIPASATLQFFAMDQALNQEATQTLDYTIVGTDLTGGVEINNGAALTNSGAVTLNLAAVDPAGVKAYMLSNDGVNYQTVAISPATTSFSATVPWILAPGDGLKTVYVKYADTPLPNNVYGPFTATITLDTLVPVTTATPAGGTYNGAINVVLSSEPGATIYYTTDPAPLTVASGQVYGGAITIPATATLQFMAVDQAGNQETVRSHSYTINGSDLTGSVVINNGAPFTKDDMVLLTLTASDPAGVKAYMLSNDGVNYQTVAIDPPVATFTAQVPWLLASGNGVKTVYVQYVDTPTPNNVYGPFTAAITLDTVAPVTQATPPGGKYNGAISVVLASEPNATIYYSTNAAPLTKANGQVYTGAITIAASATLQFMAVDQAGNQEAVQTRSYTIAGSDLIGGVEIKNGAAFTKTSAVTLNLYASDPAGVKAYMLSNDGVSYQTYAITPVNPFTATVPWTLSPGDGVKTVYVKYVDTPLPNNVYGPFTASITLDSAAPAVTATPAGGAYNGAIDVVLSSEANATIYYSTNAAPLTMANGQVYTGAITISASATLQFMAVDQAGNQGAVQTRAYTINGSDLTGGVQINNGDPFTNTTAVELTLNATDPAGVQAYMVSNDGVSYQTVAITATTEFSATVPWTLPAGDGLKTVYVKYVDTPTPNNVYGPFTASIIVDTAVPVTSATPAAGIYNGAISVVLTSEPNATIYYGIDPAPLTTANGQVYSGPLTLSATATVQFFAIDQAGNQEDVQSRGYTITASDLTGSVQINGGAAFTDTTEVNLTLNASDPAGVKAYMVSNDGVSYQTVAITPTTDFSATVPWTLPAGDGVKTVYVQYVDTPTPNNVYGPFTATITLDSVAPVTTATPAEGTYNGAISVVLTTEANATIYYGTDPAPLTMATGQVYTGAITISATATLQFMAVDQAGNQGAVQSRTYTIAAGDLTGSVQINNGAAFTNTTAVNLSLAASDPAGVKAYMLSNDGVSYQTVAITATTDFSATVPWTLPAGDGLKTVYVQYVDTPTPNNVYGPFTASITLDTVAPVTTATPAAGTYNGAINVVLATEPNATITYGIDPAPLTKATGQLYTGPITLSATATLQFMAVDQAGNQSAVHSRAYTINGSDLTGGVKINNGVAFTNTASVNLLLTASDPAGVKAYMLSNDGVSYQTYAITSTTAFSATVPWTLSAGDGVKTVYVKYVDTPTPNNVYGPFTAAITLDTTAPVTTSTPAAGTYNGAIDVVLATGPNATIYYSTDPAPLTKATGQVYFAPFTLSSTATLQFMAVDQAGNQEAVQSRSYTIAGGDLTGSIEINNGAAFTNSASVNLQLKASDPAGVKAYMLSNDGVSYQTVAVTATTDFSTTVDWTLSAGNGVKTVYVKYVDTPTPNNVYGPFTATITLDSVAPVTQATPAEGAYNGAINVVLSSEPGATIYYGIDPAPLTMATAQVYTGAITLSATATLQFMAVDQAGNQEAVHSRVYTINGSDLTGAIKINNGVAFTTSASVDLLLTASDPAGVKAYMLSNDGVSYQTYAITSTTAFSATVPWTLSAGNGQKTVYVKYVDTPEPNNVYGPFTAAITLDSVAPVTQATPAEGAYNGAISVVLASEPKATIYYSTDPAPLTMAAGQVYSGPVTLSATATLQFMAVDQAGNQEAVQSRAYTINGSDLNGSIGINNGAAFSKTASVNLTLAASDPAGVKAYMLSNDGVSYQTVAITPTTDFSATVPWTLSATDGQKTVYVKYVDTPTPNNVYGPFTATITLDSVAPVTQATPAEGAYNGAINVVLATEAKATIYYTTAAAPLTKANGQVYSGPITIPATATLQYMAVDQAGNQEAVRSRAYTIAGSDLSGSLTINNGAAFTTSATVNLALSASDPEGVKSYMLSNDGVSYQTFAISPATTAFSATVPWTLSPGAGVKSVYVKYVDAPTPSNVYGPFVAEITLDTTPPVTQATPAGGSYNGAISVTLATEPKATIHYTTASGPLTMATGQVYSGPITIAATTDLRFFAVDQAGNQEAVQTRSYTIAGSDLTASVQINKGAAVTNSTEVSLTLAAADPEGVKAYMLSNDGVSYQTTTITSTTAFGATVPWTLTAGDGQKTVYVKYVDTPEPNNVYGPFTATITLDTVAPVTQATPAEGSYNGAINVVLATEPEATIYYSEGAEPLTMAAGQVYTGAITISADATLQFMAVDQAGNQEAVQSRAYTIVGSDLTGSVQINNGAAFTNSAAVTLTLEAMDPEGVKSYMLSNDGVSYQTFAIPAGTTAFTTTVPWTLAAGDGLKTVYVKYVDTPTPNNVYGPFVAEITLDTLVPVTQATPAEGAYNGAINVVLTTEPKATIYYTTGPEPLTVANGAVYGGALTIPATVTLQFTAVDQAGNQEAVQSRAYTIVGSDLSGSVQINGGEPFTNNGTVSLTLAAMDPEGVKAYMLSNDGVSYQTFTLDPAETDLLLTVPWTLTTGDGAKTVHVKYVDTPVPNNVYGPFVAEVTLDTTAPLTQATPAAGSYNGAINVTLSSEAKATIYYSAGSEPLTVANGQVYTGALTVSATAHLQFMAVDQAGNQEAAQSRDYTIVGSDLTASVQINNGAAVTDNAKVTLSLAAMDPEGVKAYMLSNDGESYQTFAIEPGTTDFSASVPWTLAAGNGPRTVYVKYVDTPQPNNVYGPYTATITVDSVAPVTQATPAEGTYNGAINVVLVGEADTTIYYLTGSEPLTIASGQVYSGPITISETATLQFMAVDQAGNEESVHSRTYTIAGMDLTGGIEINNGAAYTNEALVELSLTAVDPEGVKAYMLSNDGESYQTFAIAPGTTDFSAAVPWTLAAGSGPKTVYVKYVDTPAPNNVYGPFVAEITLDSAAPLTQASPAEGSYNGAITVVLSSEPQAIIYYTTGSAPLTTANGVQYQGPVTISETSTLQFLAVDQAGNQGAVQSRTYTILGSDLTGGVQINSGAAITNSPSVSLALAATDPAGVKGYLLSNDGVDYQAFTLDPAVNDFSAEVPWTLAPGDGAKTVYVKYVDAPQPNNVYGPFVAEITLDTVAPATQATPAGGSYNGAINVVLTTEPTATIYYSTGSEPLTLATGQVYSAPLTISATATLQFMAVDQAGNQEAAQSRTYTIVGADLTGGVQINSGDPFTKQATVNLALSASDPEGIKAYMLSNDGVSYQTFTIDPATTAFTATVPWTLSAGNGLKTVYVKYVDTPTPNNVYGPFVDEITLDTVAPVTQASPGSGTYHGAITVVLASEPNATIYYTTGTEPLTVTNGQVYTGAITIGDTATLRFMAVDQAGNQEGVQSRSYTIIPDQGPTLELNLVSGWNLIASPETMNAASLAQAYPEVISLWKFEYGTWSVYLGAGDTAAYAMGKGFGILDTINPGEGFWLNSQAPLTLTLALASADVTEEIALTEGWNLRGLQGTASMSVAAIETLAAEQALSVVSVWTWANNSWSVSLPGETDLGASYAESKGFALLTGVNPGEGFWVNTQAMAEGVVLAKLHSGWNLLAASETVAPETMAQQHPEVISLWKFQQGNWAVYLNNGDTGAYAAGKGFAVLTTIEPGQGFWLNSEAAITLTFPAVAVSEEVTMEAGWNLLGLKGKLPLPMTTIDAMAQGQMLQVVSMWKWSNNAWSVCLPGQTDKGAAYAASKGFTMFNGVNPAEGFWINSSAL